MSYLVDWYNIYHKKLPTVPIGLGMAYCPMTTLFKIAVYCGVLPGKYLNTLTFSEQPIPMHLCGRSYLYTIDKTHKKSESAVLCNYIYVYSLCVLKITISSICLTVFTHFFNCTTFVATFLDYIIGCLTLVAFM